MIDSFATAIADLEGAGDAPAHLYEPFLDVFPVTGASVATVGNFLGSETIAASDVQAALLDELQFDLGEGPCWDAMRSAAPVLHPDIRGAATSPWPAFSMAIRSHDVASVFAFPLAVGPLRFGAIDLYSASAQTLDRLQTKQASVMAEIVGRHVLRRAIGTAGEDAPQGGAYSRRVIHQATGIVLAQLDLTPEDALLVIQGHAFGSNVAMMTVAQSIVAGELNFTRQTTGIEASQ